MNTSKFKEMSVSEMQNVDGGALWPFFVVGPILPVPITPIIRKFLIWC